MENQATNIASYLLRIKAVKISPKAPFTWASGWKSPIYCDNRLSLSYPDLRDMIAAGFQKLIEEEFPDCSAIAGVATAGIPHGAILADRMGLPFMYVRSGEKKHGLRNRIEGKVEPGLKYIVVEDLISTGGSSLQAVHALKEAGATVSGLVCIFNYGFPQSHRAFENEGLPHKSLTNLEALLEKAVEIDYIQPAEREAIKIWRKDPENWTLNGIQH